MTFGALAEFLPDRVQAGNQGTSAIVTFGGEDPRSGNRYVSYETIKGGFGARPTKDGINAVATTISNTMNTPVEVLEMSFPVRVGCYALIPDSGGAGRFRGGLGARRTWTVLGHQARGATCIERTKSAPFGLCGGKPGAAGALGVMEVDGAQRNLLSKGAFDLCDGATLWIESPGSGGYGSPEERDRGAVREDVRDGYVSQERALADYGVDLSESGDK